MPLDQILIGSFLITRSLVLHAISFREGFNLPMTKHWQSGQRRHQGAHAEIFVSSSELIDGSSFVWIAHEVDIAFEDVRIEFNRIFYHRTVFFIFLVAQHIHKRTVVDT